MLGRIDVLKQMTDSSVYTFKKLKE